MDRIWDLGFSLAFDYKDENLGLVSKIGTLWDLPRTILRLVVHCSQKEKGPNNLRMGIQGGEEKNMSQKA